MQPQDPFRTFRKWYGVAKPNVEKWYQVVKAEVIRIDAAWLKFETTFPSRIPKKSIEFCRRFTTVLAEWPPLAFLFFFALVCSRAFYWLQNAQFYIEDGKEFFAPAFNGTVGIFHDYAAYYHVIPRILSLIAASFPVKYAPLVLTLLALAVQAVAATFLMSKRL